MDNAVEIDYNIQTIRAPRWLARIKAKIRDVAKSALASRDYYLVNPLEVDNAAQLNFARALFDVVKPTLVLDVGANLGQFRSWARGEIGYRGRGISFEPLPSAAEHLRLQIQDDPSWQLRQVAIGDVPGNAVLNICGDHKGDLSSLLEPSRAHTRVLAGMNQVRGRVEVPVEVLAEHLEGITDQVFLKIDTQGSDLAVLRGAGAALTKVAAIQTELSFTPLYAGQPRATEVIDFLEAAGFVMAGMYRVNLAAFPRRMLEGEGYFIRNDLSP